MTEIVELTMNDINQHNLKYLYTSGYKVVIITGKTLVTDTIHDNVETGYGEDGEDQDKKIDTNNMMNTRIVTTTRRAMIRPSFDDTY